MSGGSNIVAVMANERNPSQVWGGYTSQRQAAITENDVPFIPSWITEWGFVIPLICTIPALAVIGAVASYDGAGDAWALVLSGTVVVATLLIYDYIRRRKKRRRAQRQELLAALELGHVDEMTPGEFEAHCGRLLIARNYRHVIKTSNSSAEKKVDFTAESPEGSRVAIEVKHRRKDSVGRPVVSKLHGDICGAPYKGCEGMIMTNAPVTEDAHSYARELGIRVVDREMLGKWLAQALEEGAQGESQPVSLGVTGWVGSRSTEAKAAAAVVVPACLVMLSVVVQVAVRAHPAAAGSRPVPAVSAAPSEASMKARVETVVAPPASRAVAMAYFAAISKHDWPEVWELGGKNLGQGLYTTYAGMVACYHGTVKDIPVALHAKGQTVSGQFLAYESDGEIRTYSFSYLVRAGVIVGAAQSELRSTRAARD